MITRGQKWRQVRSGRTVEILDPEYEDIFVRWRYVDALPSEWWYCDCHEFLFGGYVLLGPASN